MNSARTFTRFLLNLHAAAKSSSSRSFILMPVETGLYDLLDVPPDASEGEIRKAYMKKAKQQHPDKNINDPHASQKFQEIAAAYEILSDPKSRETYDNRGIDGLNDHGGMDGMDPADIFAQFFGETMFSFGPGAGAPRQRGKGEDSVIPYEVTLEDLYNGKTVKMNMEKEVVCGQCKGSGARAHAKPKSCVSCEGKGWNFVQTQISPSRIGRTRMTCHSCSGSGEKLKEKDRCKKCKGEKTVTEKTRQEIFVEQGMTNQQRIVLAGAGDQEPGVPAGDVVFVLQLQKHPSFERSGNDLLTNVTITLSEALFGFSRILVIHLDGRGVQVTSPPGKVIKPNDSIVLRGEGMPVHKQPGRRGDLYVILGVEMPDEQWLKTVDYKNLEVLLPPKRIDAEPRPEVVHEAAFEESDIVDFGGNDENDWVDEDDDDRQTDDGMEPEPQCQPQ